MIALVVDDEQDHRELVRDVLEREGWTVELAVDGLAALGSIPQVRPDVLVLDLRMPNLDGGGVLKMLRAQPAGRKVRVVVTTGAEPDRAVHELADVVLTKPFRPEALVEAVQPPRGRRGAAPRR